MPGNATEKEWKAKANDQYQRVVSSVMALATASLALPILYLKEFVGVTNKPLLKQVSFSVFLGWAFLLIAIFSGTIFYYLSAKWLKHAYGGTIKAKESTIETCLDWSFWLMVVFFLLGLFSLLWFFVTYVPEY